MEILGIRIDNFSKKEILEKIEFFLIEPKPGTISNEKVRGKFHQIATVNPEFILQAQKDEDFKNILNSCDLNVADGVGIWYAFIRNFSFLKSRIAGVDLLDEIFNVANSKKLNIYLAINKNGLSKYEEIKIALLKKYPDLKISGADMDVAGHWPASLRQADVSASRGGSLVTGCEILICNFGAPMQEKFINSAKNDTIKLAMGVGGSLDFLTGKAKRAPKLMRFLGLEWLWRLLKHSSTNKKFALNRLKRIFNSVVVFPMKVLINK